MHSLAALAVSLAYDLDPFLVDARTLLSIHALLVVGSSERRRKILSSFTSGNLTCRTCLYVIHTYIHTYIHAYSRGPKKVPIATRLFSD